MPADSRVIQALQDHGIDHSVMACDPSLADTSQFCEAYNIPPENSANTILVASRRPEGHEAACLVLATDRLDVNGSVRKKLGVRKVSFASSEQTLSRTSMEIGGVTIFGLPDDLPIWVDKKVVARDWVIVGAGSRSAKIRFDPGQLIGIDRFEVVPDLSRGND